MLCVWEAELKPRNMWTQTSFPKECTPSIGVKPRQKQWVMKQPAYLDSSTHVPSSLLLWNSGGPSACRLTEQAADGLCCTCVLSLHPAPCSRCGWEELPQSISGSRHGPLQTLQSPQGYRFLVLSAQLHAPWKKAALSALADPVITASTRLHSCTTKKKRKKSSKSKSLDSTPHTYSWPQIFLSCLLLCSFSNVNHILHFHVSPLKLQCPFGWRYGILTEPSRH